MAEWTEVMTDFNLVQLCENFKLNGWMRTRNVTKTNIPNFSCSSAMSYRGEVCYRHDHNLSCGSLY